MYRMIIIMLTCFLLFPAMSRAQDSDELHCSDDDIFAAIDDALALLEEAKSQDSFTAFESVSVLRAMLAELDTECRGLTFSGTAGTVHGPVTVPEGIYRIIATADRSFVMASTVLEGTCSHGYTDEIAIFLELQLEAGEFTTEKIFKSEGCSALFETSNIVGPYTVIFEQVQ